MHDCRGIPTTVYFNSNALVGVKTSVTGKRVYVKALHSTSQREWRKGEVLRETCLSDEERHGEAHHVVRGQDKPTKDWL